MTPLSRTQVRLRTWARRGWRYWPAAAAAASALTLAAAHAFEAAGYTPCALCLTQREIYWTALAIAAASAILWVRTPEARISRAVDALLGAAFLTGALLAAYHAGVEWGFWPGPAKCTTAGIGSIDGASLLDQLDRGGVVVLCDRAAWRDPVLQLSMAGWNVLISLALGVASFLAAIRGRDEINLASPVDD
jgi:disulfide bond formation protein DsbB